MIIPPLVFVCAQPADCVSIGAVKPSNVTVMGWFIGNWEPVIEIVVALLPAITPEFGWTAIEDTVVVMEAEAEL